MGVKLDANFGADAARRTSVGLVLFCAGHKEEVVNLQYNGIGLNNFATDVAGRTYSQVYRHLGNSLIDLKWCNNMMNMHRNSMELKSLDMLSPVELVCQSSVCLIIRAFHF